jgi:hypothetical protein
MVVKTLGKRGLGVIILNNYCGMVKQEEWRILFILTRIGIDGTEMGVVVGQEELQLSRRYEGFPLS